MNIRFTPEALAEFEKILSYLEDRSPSGAAKVGARIAEVLANLADYPLTGASTGHEGMRRIAVAPYPYLIFYLAEEHEVIIVGIRHAARDPASMPDKS